MYRKYYSILTLLCAFNLISCTHTTDLNQLFKEAIPIQNTLSKNKSIILLYFTAPDCPLARNYVTDIKTIASQYPFLDVRWIVSSRFYCKDEVKEYLNSYNVTSSTFLDTNASIANFLNVDVTPTVVLYNVEEESIIYRGKIDDKIVSLAQHKLKADTLYLIEAIQSIDQQKVVAISETKSIGCAIE